MQVSVMNDPGEVDRKEQGGGMGRLGWENGEG